MERARSNHHPQEWNSPGISGGLGVVVVRIGVGRGLTVEGVGLRVDGLGVGLSVDTGLGVGLSEGDDVKRDVVGNEGIVGDTSHARLFTSA